MQKGIKDLLAEHPFFQDLTPEYLELVAGCGRNARFEAGTYLGKEGEKADSFCLIRSGTVAVETHAPGRGVICLQTLHVGDVAGWSWIFPPYEWTFDLKATEQTLVVALDGKCLRQKCEQDTRLGYTLMKKFAGILTARLRATRLQLLDVYGSAGSK